MPSVRGEKINNELKRELSVLIRDIKDPRVPSLCSVIKCEVTKDLKFAKVYVSSMSGIDDAKEAVKGLTSATGLIRREVGSKLHLRKTPELKFIADDSVQHGMEIFKKIESTKVADDEE